MKKVISTLSFLLFLSIMSLSAQCCGSTSSDNSATSSSCCSASESNTEVHAYYFHATRRCATCQAVEAVSKEAIQDYYGEKVSFQSINRDEAANKALVEKYKITGTALLIVSGGKVVNLTNEAFLNARNNPEKLKQKIKTTIDTML